jgi:hypothetical protein
LGGHVKRSPIENPLLNVIAGLVPAISVGKHCAILVEMAGTSPAVTIRRVNPNEKML